MKASVISALGLVAATSAAYNQSTTSTVYTTSVYTITSCAPTVTDCPGRIGQVTTDIISLYTTICPVTETQKTYTPISTPVATYTPWTTSTVYSTKEYTITSCPPEVTNCPVGSKTSTIITSTTSCPVTTITSAPYTMVTPPKSETTVISKPYVQGPPPPPASSKPVISTITISTCVPSYYTSVVTVSATGPAGNPTYTPVSPPVGTGYPVAPSPPKNTTTPYVPVTGGASTVKVGALMAVGLVAALL